MFGNLVSHILMLKLLFNFIDRDKNGIHKIENEEFGVFILDSATFFTSNSVVIQSNGVNLSTYVLKWLRAENS